MSIGKSFVDLCHTAELEGQQVGRCHVCAGLWFVLGRQAFLKLEKHGSRDWRNAVVSALVSAYLLGDHHHERAALCLLLVMQAARTNMACKVDSLSSHDHSPTHI